VTAVTASPSKFGETDIVIIGSVARKKAIFEPDDNEAAEERGSRCQLRFIQGLPVAAYYRPPVAATGPRHYLVFYRTTSASEAKVSFGGDFFGGSSDLQVAESGTN
jgi:hypothetical protein